MHRLACTIGVGLLLSLGARPSAQPTSPTIDELLNLRRVGSPAVAPDARSVAYTLRETNWDDNEFETEIWVATGGSEPRQLTSARKSSSATGVVTQRPMAGFCFRSRWQATALSNRDRWRRGRAPHERRRRHQRVCVGARQRADRVHDDRSHCRQRQGARKTIRRHPHRRRRPAHVAFACNPRQSHWHELGAAIGAHQRCFCGGVV